MTMVTMLVFSILLAVAFTAAAIWIGKGLSESVSSTVYVLPERGGWRWLWTIWLWTVTLTLAPALMEALPDEWRILGFAALVCLGMTGAMPVTMKEHKPWHDIFGVAAGVLSQICVFIICPDWLCVWMAAVFLIGSGYVQPDGWLGQICKGRQVFIAEAACACGTYGAVMIVLVS